MTEATETKRITSRSDLPRVVYVPSDPFEIVINAGSSKVKIGSRFLIIGTGEEIHDPSTGKVLDVLEIIRGTGKVIHVQENISTIRSIMKTRKAGPIKRIVKEGLNGMSFMFNNTERVVEETQVEEEDMPFSNVVIGDYARQL